MVSIVIPNYNGNKYLKECVESIYKQYKNNIELIIIDNASEDGNYKWLKTYRGLVFIRLDQNYGFSKAVNEGIKLAKGEYVLLLNNDTVLEDNFLYELIEIMKQDNKIFAVSSKMISYYNKNIIDDAGDEYNILGWTLKRGDGKSVEYYSQSGEVFSVCAGAALYRKSIFEKIGYFDEHFFAYMEDVDISYRAHLYGYKTMYCADAKVYHIGSATSGSRYNSFKVKLAARNNIFVIYKNMPVWQIFINSPFLSIGFIIKYLFFLKKGLGDSYKEGIIEGIKNRHKLEKIQGVSLSVHLKMEIELIKNTFNFIINHLGWIK